MEQVRQISSLLDMLLNSLDASREKQMVLRWKEEIETFGVRRLNRQKILTAIKDGADTLEEITSETRIPRATAYKILKKLTAEGVISKTKVRSPNNRIEFRFHFNSN